jgi:hypothetical protein
MTEPTADGIATAITYLDAWASLQHHRAITKDSSIPQRASVDGDIQRVIRTRGHHIPSIQARYLTVEIILRAKKDKLLRALLLHIYPTSGSYYRGRYLGSFRHSAIKGRVGGQDKSLARKFLDQFHREFRTELAVWLSDQGTAQHPTGAEADEMNHAA